VIDDWNWIPKDIKNIPTAPSFKKAYAKIRKVMAVVGSDNRNFIG
jgi:hypothetical protein